MNKKRVDPAISEHYRKMQEKSWAVRKKKIIERAKIEKEVIPTPNEK